MLLNLPVQICYQDNKRKKVTCTQVTYNPNLISVSNVSVEQTIDVEEKVLRSAPTETVKGYDWNGLEKVNL